MDEHPRSNSFAFASFSSFLYILGIIEDTLGFLSIGQDYSWCKLICLTFIVFGFWITGKAIPIDGLLGTVETEWLLRCWSRTDSRKPWAEFVQVSTENGSSSWVMWKKFNKLSFWKICLVKYACVIFFFFFHSRNEKEGIPVELIQHLDVCVEVPQEGVIRSMNVHVTGAIFIWEYVRQQIGLPRWKASIFR